MSLVVDARGRDLRSVSTELKEAAAKGPVLVQDAEWAARRWRRGEGLSLADRLCLALAERTDEEVLTADGSWGRTGRVRQIR